MHLFTLARVAAEAELLRLRLFAKRQAMRSVWVAVAAVFGLFTLVMLHIAVTLLLWPSLRVYAPLVPLGVDVVATGVFAFMGLRSVPGPAELEAAAISKAAQRKMKETTGTFLVLAPVAKFAGSGGVKRALMTALFTGLMTRRKR